MKLLISLLMAVILLSQNSWAQDFVFDLSTSAGDTLAYTADKKGNYKIELLNKLPAFSYSVRITREKRKISSISLPSEIGSTDEASFLFVVGDSDCINLKNMADGLFGINDETALVPDKRRLELEIIRLNDSKKCQAEISYSKKLLSYTANLDTVEVKPDEDIYVHVSRVIDAATTKEWTFKIEGPSRGSWGIMYGYAFATNIFHENDSHYLEQYQDSLFQIAGGSNNDLLDYIPTIYFVFTPSKKNCQFLKCSFVGGLGIESESPTVSLGFNAFLNHNISLSVGAVIHKKRKLLGRYSQGQILDELLTDDQLFEEVYRPNLYFSVQFRLDRNPFSNN